MSIVSGKTEDHLDMLDNMVVERLLNDKWSTFARVKISIWKLFTTKFFSFDFVFRFSVKIHRVSWWNFIERDERHVDPWNSVSLLSFSGESQQFNINILEKFYLVKKKLGGRSLLTLLNAFEVMLAEKMRISTKVSFAYWASNENHHLTNSDDTFYWNWTSFFRSISFDN